MSLVVELFEDRKLNTDDIIANGDFDALKAQLDTGADVNTYNDGGQTPLMVAVESPLASIEMLKLLIDSGADVNAVSRPPKPPMLDIDDELSAEIKADMRKMMLEAGFESDEFDSMESSGFTAPTDTVLSLAVKQTTMEQISFLIHSGADVQYVSDSGYSILNDAMSRTSKDDLMDVVTLLIESGAPLDVASDYGETILGRASYGGYFELVNLLLEKGADPAPLGWTPFFFEIAKGNLDAIKQLSIDKKVLKQRDRWNRTPFLLSVHAGHLGIAKFLVSCGSDPKEIGHCEQTALMYAVKNDNNVKMIEWLIEQGCDVNQTDDSDTSPLAYAAGNDALACAKLLLQAGAITNRRNEFGDSAVSASESREMIKLLAAAGGDLNELDAEGRRILFETGSSPNQLVSNDDYFKFRHRSFGTQNPERMNNPFWDHMVRSRLNAYCGAEPFEEATCHDQPVWCFDRFGHSITELPDGRYVEIGGEHEDYYDPDFCIYNDVVVHNGPDDFDIYGYPKEVFPPTDFHSATLVEDHIYIIGCLGYVDDRKRKLTPVYRLCTKTWKIEHVVCQGKNPGWIHKHKARCDDGVNIVISGGETPSGAIKASSRFTLNLETRSWTKKGWGIFS